MEQIEKMDNSSPQSWGLLDVADHISDVSESEGLKDQLSRFLENYVYHKIEEYEPLYAVLPFWSHNVADPVTGQRGHWRAVPGLVRDRDIALAYATFFSCISNPRIVPVSFTKLIARESRRIPFVIEFDRSGGIGIENWNFDKEAVSINSFQRKDFEILRISIPYLSGLSVNLETESEKKSIIYDLVGKNSGKWIPLSMESIQNVSECLEQLDVVVKLKESNIINFEKLCDQLHRQLKSKKIDNRLKIDSWRRVDSLGLLKFISAYNIIPEWKHAYHIPSQIRKYEGVEYGSGGPIFATSQRVSESDLADLIIATNLEYRFSSLADWEQRAKSEVLEESKRSALAAIMARNMSHNIGSHVLASPDLLKEGLDERVKQSFEKEDSSQDREQIVKRELEAGRREVQTLHNFLQQRMDFISQVVSYTPSWGEPIFFFDDLLRGFARQELLLSFLVKDQGYEKERIRFIVHYGGKCRSLRVGEEGRGEDRNSSGDDMLEDFLVAIPGGAIGAHAFYDILENVMRNSAKYGESGQNLEVHLNIERDPTEEERYRVTLWDNLSPQGNVDRVGVVREHLVTPLVDPQTGNTETEGRGVHEIKACAGMLAHPYGDADDWQFEVESNGNLQNLPVRAVPHPQKTDEQETQYLSYQFYLQNPHLVGIAYLEDSTRSEQLEKEEAKAAGFFSYTSEEDGLDALMSLTECAHQFGIIWMPKSGERWEEVLDFVAENQHTLPYRLLIATSQQEKLKQALQRHEGIPARRAHLCDKRDLRGILDRASQEQTREGWAKAVIDIYELWLKNFKSLDEGKKWQIAILLEREEGHPAFERWKECLDDDFDSSIVEIHIGRFYEDKKHKKKEAIFDDVVCSTDEISSGEELAREIESHCQHFIVFDNHGGGLSSLDNAHETTLNYRRPDIDLGPDLACYHRAGLKHAFRIYQSIESPPRDSFGVTYFVLGLVESALTNVLVIDERVAEATFTEDKQLSAQYRLLEKLREARVYPVYSLRTQSAEVCHRTFLSDAIERTQAAVIEGEGIEETVHPKEGLYLTEGSGEKREAYVKRQKTKPAGSSTLDEKDSDREGDLEENEKIDVIVVHQGVLDRLANFTPARWEQKDIQSLYQLSPSVIVTSGRGRTLREGTTPKTMPFVEFSIVRESTYADISKYHLIRALLSVTGERN